MGRPEQHAYGCDGIVFELEWAPFTDGGYDAGGAYWGTPDNLYAAVGTLDGELVVECFLRADYREQATASLLADYPDCTVLPENGSLIKQMIEFLEEYVDRSKEKGDETADLADAEQEIDDLCGLLEEKGLI